MATSLVLFLFLLFERSLGGVLPPKEDDTSVSISVTITVDWLYPPGPSASKTSTTSSAPLPTEPTSENPWTGLSTIGYGTPASTNIDPYYPVPAPPSSRKSEVEIVTVTSTPLASCYQPTIVEISTETELPTPVSTLIRTRPVTITTVTTTAYSTILAVDEEDEEPTSTKSSCVSGKHDIACRAGFTVDASQVL